MCIRDRLITGKSTSLLNKNLIPENVVIKEKPIGESEIRTAIDEAFALLEAN